MKTLIIWEQAPFNRIEWEWIIEKTAVIQALSYLHENKWKVDKIIIKNLPEDGIKLTHILNVFIAEPTLIHNAILFLADTNVDFSLFDKEIKQIEEISGKKVVKNEYKAIDSNTKKQLKTEHNRWRVTWKTLTRKHEVKTITSENNKQKLNLLYIEEQIDKLKSPYSRKKISDEKLLKTWLLVTNLKELENEFKQNILINIIEEIIISRWYNITNIYKSGSKYGVQWKDDTWGISTYIKMEDIKAGNIKKWDIYTSFVDENNNFKTLQFINWKYVSYFD